MIAPGVLVRPRESATYRSEFIEVYKTNVPGDSERAGVMTRDMTALVVCTTIESGPNGGWCMVVFDDKIGWVYHLAIETIDGLT